MPAIYKRFLTLMLVFSLVVPMLSFSAGAAADISVSAQSAVLMCADDNSVVFEKNSRKRMPMASTTKIMTCIVAIEKGDLSETVKVSPKAVGVEGSSLYLQKGDSLSLEGLLYALMLRSANDSAAAIAYHIGGSIEGFAELMNEKAAELGLQDTHFTNPHGLQDDEHYTTAYDFALLASYAMKNETFAKIVGSRSYNVSLNGGDCLKTVVNHNKMLRLYDGANGVKTGFTRDSGRCLVSSATRDGVTMIAVTLNAPSDWHDHEKMLDLGFSEYSKTKVLDIGQIAREFEVAGCAPLTVRNEDEVWVTLKNGSSVDYTVTASQRLLFSPVNKGDVIAHVNVVSNGNVIAEVPLYASEDRVLPEEEKSFFEKIADFFRR